MEIEDKRTVYGECTYRLVPREDEPSVCLMHDWIDLPSCLLYTSDGSVIPAGGLLEVVSASAK